VASTSDLNASLVAVQTALKSLPRNATEADAQWAVMKGIKGGINITANLLNEKLSIGATPSKDLSNSRQEPHPGASRVEALVV
jgi:hypothetical protein